MSLFRVDRHDGHTASVRALRVRAVNGELVFQMPQSNGAWQTQYQVPAHEVAAVSRRVTELNGAIRWVKERPREASTAAN